MTTVAVVGAGTMGISTALALAHAEYTVLLNDISETALSRAISAIEHHSQVLMIETVDESYENGAQSWDPDLILSRVTAEPDLGKLSTADVIIENVTEDLDVKKSVHGQLDEIVSLDTLVLINTSCIPITTITSDRSDAYAGNTVGTHLLNPVPRKHVAELIAGHRTTADALFRATEFLASIDVASVRAPDTVGFIINRMAMGLANEGARLVEEGVPAADVDRLLAQGLGHQMGILRTVDLIGVRTVARSLWVLYDGLGERYRPCRLLVEMAENDARFFP